MLEKTGPIYIAQFFKDKTKLLLDTLLGTLKQIQAILGRRRTQLGISDEETPENPTTHITPSSDNKLPTNLQQVEMVIITDNLDDGAPNLLLNCHDRVGRREIYLAAALGIILQLGAILYFGVITYHEPIQHHFLKDGKEIVLYAFPCAAIGTMLLVFGLFICSWAVGQSTKETFYEAGNHEMFIVWLQKDHTVSDQEFRPYAIYPASKRDYFTMSRRNIEDHPKEIRDLCRKILCRLSEHPIVRPFQTTLGKLSMLCRGFMSSRTTSANQNDPKAGNMSSENSSATRSKDEPNEQPLYSPLRFITVIGSFISLMGFISQFIGMRGLNWTASIVQLGITIVVTILRVIVRRGLAKAPNRTVLKSKFELDWFVLSFGNLAAAHWINFDKNSANALNEVDDSGAIRSSTWEICTGGEQTYHPLERLRTDNQDSLPHQIMLARKHLGHSSKWISPVLEEAISLSRAIEAVANTFLSEHSKENYEWRIPATYTANKSTKPVNDNVYITIFKDKDDRWRVDEAEIEAILSLWLYSTTSTNHSKTRRPRSLRVYGPSESEQRLIRDLGWWMRENIPQTFKYTENKLAGPTRERTIVGFRTEDGSAKRSTKTTAQNDPIQKYLVLECQDEQQRLFSRDLFFSFMRAIAKMPEVDIASASSAHPSSSSTITKGWKQVKLKNEIISDLVGKLEKIGFGSLSDIYIDLIIPLSLEHKLTNVKNIIDDVTKEAHEHERSLQWKKLVDTCVYLLNLALQFDLEKESSGPLAVAICLGFLYRLHHEEKLQYSERRTEEEFTTQLKKFKEKFANEKIQSLAYFPAALANEINFSAVSLSMLAGSNNNNTAPFSDSFRISVQNLEVLKERELEHKPQISAIRDFEKTDAFGWSLLHYAANFTFDIDDSFNTSDESLNLQDLMGWAPLHHACFFGNEKLVNVLLDHGARIEIAGNDGITPMHCAVQSGKPKIIQILMDELDKREKTNSRKSERHVDRNERHPIHWAAVEGNVEMVRSMGKYIHLIDRFGWTALHLAAIYGYKDVLRHISEHHADAINAGDKKLRTPLYLAVEYEFPDAVQTLIQAGAKVSITAKDGLTPFHVAAKQKRKQIFNVFLKHGTNNVDVLDMEGRTPLYQSVEDGEIKTMNMLIQAGANVKVARKDGRTPLHVALSRGKDGLEIAKRLFQAGADINTTAEDGATLLHIAAQCGTLFEILSFLSDESLESLDIDAIDEFGQTPLLAAIYKADWKAAKLLLEMGANVKADKRSGYTPVLGAVVEENEDILQQLLDKGARVNNTDGDGYSALHLATLSGNQKIVQALLKAKADIDAVVPGRNETPLHIAVRKEQTEIVQTLLERGAKTTLLNNMDFSPLQYALYRGDVQMVQVLIEHDKKSTMKAALQKNKEGDTPLHTLAACTKDEDIIFKMLDEVLSIGPEIDINAKNSEGLTPLDLALLKASEHPPFIARLQEKGAKSGSEETKKMVEA